MAGGVARWLLIGNSRWHWAEAVATALRVWHTAPPAAEEMASALRAGPLAWAAVGRLPPEGMLPPQRRLQLEDVPLGSMPPWLGVDRALAGWLAWQEAGGSVLVADAGTVLSLTRVDGSGHFSGGRLMAGVALQQRAMVAGTAGLAPLTAMAVGGGDGAPPWPTDTRGAMASGIRRGLAAAVVAAAREASAEDPACRIVLTGGDAPLLQPLVAPALAQEGLVNEWRADLCLEALVRLRPLPESGCRDGAGQSSPRSEST